MARTSVSLLRVRRLNRLTKGPYRVPDEFNVSYQATNVNRRTYGQAVQQEIDENLLNFGTWNLTPCTVNTPPSTSNRYSSRLVANIKHICLVGLLLVERRYFCYEQKILTAELKALIDSEKTSVYIPLVCVEQKSSDSLLSCQDPKGYRGRFSELALYFWWVMANHHYYQVSKPMSVTQQELTYWVQEFYLPRTSGLSLSILYHKNYEFVKSVVFKGTFQKLYQFFQLFLV